MVIALAPPFRGKDPDGKELFCEMRQCAACGEPCPCRSQRYKEPIWFREYAAWLANRALKAQWRLHYLKRRSSFAVADRSQFLMVCQECGKPISNPLGYCRSCAAQLRGRKMLEESRCASQR